MTKRPYREDGERLGRLIELAQWAMADIYNEMPNEQHAHFPTLRDPKGDPSLPVNDLRKGWGIAMGAATAALYRWQSELPEAQTFAQVSDGFDVGGDGWNQFCQQEALRIATSPVIESFADAAVKATAYLNLLSRDERQDRWFFRGQTDATFELRSRRGRRMADLGMSSEPGDTVTQYEIDELRAFQKEWTSLDDVDEIDRQHVDRLDRDDSAWWFYAQHYDDEGWATRLLDVTTSLSAGLYFACADWDGGVDEAKDGVLLLIHQTAGLRYGPYQQKTVETFFDSAYPDTPELVFEFPGNERSKAQGGSFIWHPRPELAMRNASHLVVGRMHKKAILRELLAFGVDPRQIVRGKRGEKADRKLREFLRRVD